jgi:acetylglutamate kinase
MMPEPVHPLAPLEKASILIEALPYIRQFQGQIMVIKLGGSALIDDAKKRALLQDVALLHMVGIKPLIIHGGGPAINQHLEQLGVEPHFKNGLRMTDEQTMSVVEMILCGQVGKDLVGLLGQLGVPALSLSGKDAHLLLCEKHEPQGDDIGYVGTITQVNHGLLKTLMDQGLLPVLSSVSMGEHDGHSYNVNADYAAIAVASALGASKLVYMSDVPGVLGDVANPNSLLPHLTLADVPRLIEEGVIAGGMLPKVQCCLDGVRAGIERVHILDGRKEHSLLLEVFTDEGNGTMFTAQ